MRILRHLIIIGFASFIALGCAANSANKPTAKESLREERTDPAAKPESGGMTSLRGRVIRKGWSKSPESWRAGGSEYYVLDVGNTVLGMSERTAKEGVILRPSEVVAFSEFEKYKNKPVEVVGVFVPNMDYKEYYGHEIDPRNQCLMEPDPLKPGAWKPAKLGGGFRVNSIRTIEG